MLWKEKTVVKKFSYAVAAAVAALFITSPAFSAGAADLVYIPLGSAGKVVVVDAGKDTIVGEIKGLPAVHGLAATPDGRYLIAGSFDERAAGGGKPAKPEGVTEDEHNAHHGGGAATGSGSTAAVLSTVSIVRTEDGKVVRRIDVPGAVHHVAVSPDGKLAAVTHPNAGSVSVIDLRSYTVAATVATGPLPNYAAFSPDNRLLYVSNAGNNTVSAVNAGKWTIAWSVAVGSSPEHVVLSRDGATIYVNNIDDGSVSVIATGSRKVVKTIPIGSTLHGIDLSDDGKTLFVAVLEDDKVVAYDLAKGTYSDAPLAPAPYHLAVIRGAGKIYVSSASEPKIWVLDPKDLTLLGEIKIGGKGHQMVRGVGG